jgi:hypothetical protein
MFQRGGFCLTRRKPLALACICGRSDAIKRGRWESLLPPGESKSGSHYWERLRDAQVSSPMACNQQQPSEQNEGNDITSVHEVPSKR